MTNKQHPGGVAGRVLQEQQENVEHYYQMYGGNDYRTMYQEGIREGIHQLNKANSREARAFITEMNAEGEALTLGPHEAVDYLCTRLGLTLTDDEPGGCYPHGLEASGE